MLHPLTEGVELFLFYGIFGGMKVIRRLIGEDRTISSSWSIHDSWSGWFWAASASCWSTSWGDSRGWRTNLRYYKNLGAWFYNQWGSW
jgi:hypothetical protein